MLPGYDNDHRVQSEYMYTKYKDYCTANQVTTMANTTKMGVAMHRLFDVELKQHHVKKIPKYFYENMTLVTDQERARAALRIHLPPGVSYFVDGNVNAVFIPTTIFINDDLLEFKCFVNMDTYKYWITVRGIELDTNFLGLSQTCKYDQLFVTGLYKICTNLNICKGKETSKIPEDYQGTKIQIVDIGDLGHDEQVENARKTWYSRRCKGVLQITCQKTNFTCSSCIHDVNNAVRALEATEEDEEVMILSTSQNTSQDDMNSGRAKGGAVRRGGSPYDEDDNRSQDGTESDSSASDSEVIMF